MLYLVLKAVHVLAVMAWECQYMRSSPWLADTWAPRILVAATLVPLLAPSLMVVVYPGWDSRLGPLALGVLTFIVVLTGAFYTLVRRDTFMLTAAAGSVMTVVTANLARLLVVTLDLGLLGLQIQIKKGTPVNLFANLDPTSTEVKLRLGKLGVKEVFGGVFDPNARTSLFNGDSLGTTMLQMSNCPDLIEDKGHDFGAELSAEDKKSLIEYLKTL